MGIMVYSLLWVMQDFVHQQYGMLFGDLRASSFETLSANPDVEHSINTLMYTRP